MQRKNNAKFSFNQLGLFLVLTLLQTTLFAGAVSAERYKYRFDLVFEEKMRRPLVAIFVALTAVLLMTSGPVRAAEVKSSVIAVDVNNAVELELPPGSNVSPGDEVRIQAEVPGVGLLSIKTRWRIVQVNQGRAVAVPQGDVTGKPQVGYSVIITTANVANSAPASGPAFPVAPRRADPVAKRTTDQAQSCDHYGADPNDPDIAGLVQGVEFADLDTEATIEQCLLAIKTWPDTPRFYAHLARGYFKDGQTDKAHDVILTGMEKGSGQAVALMAVLYQNGFYVQQDLRKALGLYERAAAAGNPGGMVFAASMYFHGEGAAANATTAARYYHMAAEIGIPEAYANLGTLYDSGQGVEQNSDEAAEYLLLALALDSSLARTILLEDFSTLRFDTRIAIQMILSDSGNYSGTVNGADDPATRRALLAHIMRH